MGILVVIFLIKTTKIVKFLYDSKMYYEDSKYIELIFLLRVYTYYTRITIATSISTFYYKKWSTYFTRILF